MSLDFARFVDRDQELSDARDLINSLANNGFINYPIREFIGIGGIGKSVFLQAICKICDHIGISYVFINFADFEKKNTPYVIWKIFEKFSKTFSTNSDESLGYSWQEFYKNCVLNSQNIDQILPPSEIIEQFLDLSSNLHGVVFFDSVDQIVSETLEYLGQELIFPISDTGRIIVFIASRGKVDWGSPKYKIRRRTKTTTLKPFSQESTHEQLSGTPYQELSQEIQSVTSGHPASNDIVVEILNYIESIEKQKINRELFGDYEARMVSAIVDKVIRQKVIVPEPLFRAFCVLSVLRRFDIDLPAELLAKINPSVNWQDPFPVMDLVRSMLKTDYLVSLDTEKNGYSIDPYVRKALSLYLRFTSPLEYLNITKEAFAYYDRKLLKAPNDYLSLIEKLYHLADIIRLSKPQKFDLGIAITIKSQLEKDLINCLGVPYESYLSETNRPTVTDAEERRRLFDRLKTALEQDQEFIERLGDTEGFLLQALDDFQKELLDTGKAVLDIVKHQPILFSSLEKKLVEEYSVSFHISQRNVDITVPLDLPIRRKEQLIKDVRFVSSIEDLIDIGKAIKNHFLPAAIQEKLNSHDGSLIISVNDTDIPWEVIHDEEDFISLKMPLGKRLRTAEVAKVNRRRAEPEIRPLLIGVTETVESGFDPLPNVEDEIVTITNSLKNVPGWTFSPANDVILGGDADSYQFLKKLGSGRYDVIHFAGHTYFDSTLKTGGLVLSDTVVSMDEIKRSVGGRPLVFLNACQSANSKTVEIDTGYVGSYTLGISSAFILGGALACVGSIWKVFDGKGAAFALRFYKELLSGVMIGEALRRAKVQTRSEDPTDKTWASYVLFGDPTAKLHFS